MTVFYSEYFPLSTAPGVEGRSQVDLTSTTFADLFAQAANYNPATSYTKGMLVYDQNSIWVYINSLPTAGNPPPTLPTVSNVYWELVGTTATNTFVWIAYANSDDGITFTDFTTGNSTAGGIVRRWMGVAVNKTSAVESTVATDYSWTKIVGSDGAPGASGTSPIFAYVSRDNIVIPTDTNGTNPILLNSGTSIWVYEGSSPLNYNAVGTTNGTWRVGSTAILPAGGITLGSISDSGSNATAADITAMSQDAVTVTYNIVGKSTTGVDFAISKSVNYTKNKGAVIDYTPPVVTSGLGLTTQVITMPGGELQSKIIAVWTANTDTDFSYYEVEIKQTAQADTSYINFQTSRNTYEWNVAPNVSYTVRIRAVDNNENRSAYSTTQSITSATGTVDQAARINAGTTAINADKVLIGSSTYLSNWRNGSDTTKIEGGSIAANTISANKIQIGARGVDISGIEFQAIGNVLSWSGGTITYTKDDGTIATPVVITAGNVTWTTGTLYIYWVKNDTTPNTVLSSNTATGTAYGPNNIVLATYRGGLDFVVNYGRTIVDGAKITTGTIDANRLKADSAIVNNIQVGGSNFVIDGAAQGAGKGTLTVNNGTVDLLRLGYLDASTVGFQLKNSSNEVLLASTTSLSSISNSSISISSNGTLSGGGGGQVTITGLGYTGALDATKGAVIGSNLTGTFTEAEFNARFNTGTIDGTYIKNASIDTAQIKDAAINSAKIANLAVDNGKIANLAVDAAKIADLTVSTIKIANQAVTIPSAAYTAAVVAANNTTVQSLTVSTTGAPVVVSFSFNLANTLTSGATVTLKRGTTTLVSGSIFAAGFHAATYIDTPSAGSYTYSVVVSTGNIQARSMTTLEAKK